MERQTNHPRSSQSHRWNFGPIRSSSGYVKIRVGIGHPFADPKGYAYEHLIVWVSSGRKVPSPNEVIHHRNDDRTDNRIENLELMSRSKHNSHHVRDRVRDNKGRFLEVTK